MIAHILARTFPSLLACLLLAASGVAQEGRTEPPKTQPPKAEPAPKEQQPQQQQDPLAKLKEQMKARYADLERLRDAGKVGETWNGEVAVVKPAYETEKVDPRSAKSQTIAELVGAENTDRKQLYALLAKDLKTTAAEVGKQNGLRHVDKAKPDHWLRLEDGRWVQRKDIKPTKEPKQQDGAVGGTRSGRS